MSMMIVWMKSVQITAVSPPTANNSLYLQVSHTIRYDTILFGRFTCAQKLTRWPLSLAHGTETKNKKNKTRCSSSFSGCLDCCESQDLCVVRTHGLPPRTSACTVSSELFGFWFYLGIKPSNTKDSPQIWMIQPPKHDSNKFVLPPNICFCISGIAI